jgi:rubrerythrin
MAIVKANYVKRGKGCKARAKATIRYITHRRDRDNNKVTRVLTGFDGELTKEQAYRMIDEAKRGTIFYRLVISPDPRREDKYKDLSLSDMTLSTIYKLEERLGREVQFVATEHNDHSPHRHTHLLVLVTGRRLTKEDFKALRQEATDQARVQRRMRDQFLSHQQTRVRSMAKSHQNRAAQTHTAVPGYTRRRPDSTYPRSFRPLAAYNCPICNFHEVKAFTNRILVDPNRCPYCGVKMKRDLESMLTLSLRPGREVGFG